MNNLILGLYAVPDPKSKGGGPKTRVSKMSAAIKHLSRSNIVVGGSPADKIRSIFGILATKIDICYVESATNRVRLVDLFCLLILRIKAKKMVVYIRDVYRFVLNSHTKRRSRISLIANSLTHRFFNSITDSLAFPTMRMGQIYNGYYETDVPYFELPPGTFDVSYFNLHNGQERTTRKLDHVNFLYLGNTDYANSGIEVFYTLVEKLSGKFGFHILTHSPIEDELKRRMICDKLVVKSATHNEVLAYFEDKNITFLVHSRPRNTYDDITFPIKIMDCVSAGIPIISLRHKPLVDLLGVDYPFFMDDLTHEHIESVFIDESRLKERYLKALHILYRLKETWSYENQIKRIIRNVENNGQ